MEYKLQAVNSVGNVESDMKKAGICMRKTKKAVPVSPAYLSCALGAGILSGLAGTAAITAAQSIEMKLTGRSPSDTPVRAAEKALAIAPAVQERKGQVNNLIHWCYGVVWGLFRTLLAITGVRGLRAVLAHFIALWAAGMALLPALKVSTPPWKWGAKSLLIDGLLHGVYAAGAGAAFTFFSKSGKRRRR